MANQVSAEAEKQMLEVIKGMKDIQALNEIKDKDLQETKNQMAAIGKEAAEKLEAAQKNYLDVQAEQKKQQSELDKVKKDYEALYKQMSRPNFAATGENPIVTKYNFAFSEYIRKGAVPDNTTLQEIAHELVKKSVDEKKTEDFTHAVNGLVREQGDSQGKGFYMLPERKNSLVTGSNPDGGYFTLPDRRTDITVTRIFETSPMRAVSQIITTGSNEVEIIIDDNTGVSGGWIGEVTTPTQTNTPQVGLLKIPVHEQFAQPQITQKMLDDSFVNIEQWLSRKTDDILTRTENTAFVSGDGSNKPKGFLSYAAWSSAGVYERGKLENVNSGLSGAFTADGLRNLQGALLEEYQAGASFLTKRDNFTSITLLKDGVGRYLMNERMLPDGVDIRLLGKPLYFANDMQAIGAAAAAIAYGDFGVGYTIVDRQGIRVLRDPYTAKPYIKFYTTKRVGGAVTNYQAIKIQLLS